MKKSIFIGIILVAGVLLYSCTKVVNVSLDSTLSRIVIEGNITDSDGPYQVQISKTVNFNATNSFPPVSGATVKITDNTSGKIDTLTEASPGIYKTHALKGIYGHTYQLYVLTEGQNYSSSSTMPLLVVLDSVTFQRNSIFGTNEINAVVNFQDPPDVSNYYTLTQYVNSRRLKNTDIFDDHFSQGRYITQQIFSDSTYISKGDTVTLQLKGVDKAVWNYFNTLGQATGNDFQSVSPSNPISNISNNALGYFSASAVSTKKGIAK